MKAILSLIISGALVVSGFGQTRNVLVGTNNTVVQPTNFWSADASNARTGLGLGTAATNPASAFQPSSSALTNLASGNGGALTNLQATNLVGLIPTSNIPSILLTNIGTITIAQGGTGATNAANARQNLGSTTVGDALFIATNVAAARTAIGATTIGSSVFTLANPSAITFLRLNADNTASALTASDFRTALSLGTAATNPSSVFQPSSAVLSNLASSNGVNLTNLQASNVTGTIAISNGGSGATNAGEARINFGLGNIFTNTFQTTNTAVYINTNIVATNSALYLGFVNAAYLDAPWFFVGDGTNGIIFETTDVAAITRTNLGIGAGATNTVGFGKIQVGVNNLIIEEPASPAAIITFPSDTDPVILGSNYWNYDSVRQSLGFSTNLTSFWTATNVATARTALNLDQTNSVAFLNLRISNGSQTNLAVAIGSTNRGFYGASGPPSIRAIVDGFDSLLIFTNAVEVNAGLNVVGNSTFGGNISFVGANSSSNAAVSRTNLGLGWSALTNTNAGTGLVSVNTNGEVVSPTNFWQVAPIVAQFIESQPTTNSTTNIVGARLLHIHSLATNIVNVTNTIALPTNGTSFAGDIALVVHQGPTNSMTRVRQAGSTNNLITMTRFDEAVELVYYENEWQLNHNIAFVEPIYFAGTNASANAAASRTNLGLGQFKDAVGDNWAELYDNGELRLQAGNTIIFYESFDFGGTNAADFREQSRISLGLGATNNVTFSNITASGTLTATSTVTAKTNLVVEGFVNYTAARTNNTPTNTPNFAAHAAWIEVKVGTNSFFLPAYQ